MNRRDEPELQRRRLRSQLRRFRLNASITQQEAAEKLYWSPSKVLRIEQGANSVSITDLKAMLDLYGIRDEDTVNQMVALARTARRPSWTNDSRDAFPPDFVTFLNLERAAVRVLLFETRVIPGLLQTEDYARRTMRSYSEKDISPDVVERRVQVRLARQELLHGGDQPELRVVLDEAVVRRLVGGRTGQQSLMQDQLERLRDLAVRTGVAIRIMPFAAGEHPGMSAGSFTILEFEDPDDERILFLEHPAGDLVTTATPDGLPSYLDLFDELEQLALSPGESARLLDLILSELREDVHNRSP